ncbi:phage virion morphogenesis protein [Erwinia aphidicola]|uniref:phage virion morphogenesis protein n=1 Tax=Erwinia aphidicola TaxID=68334 RepID=UPI003CF53F44
MNALEPVEARLSALIASLSAPARKKLASSIARKLRASQQRNIRRQQAPDGTPFKPRKKQPLRGKKGRIKREMFAKLRTVKYMKSKGTGDDAAVEFTGRVQRMVRVHHYGLRDRPARGGQDVQYEARPLLGFSDDDLEMIEQEITHHLAL